MNPYVSLSTYADHMFFSDTRLFICYLSHYLFDTLIFPSFLLLIFPKNLALDVSHVNWLMMECCVMENAFTGDDIYGKVVRTNGGANSKGIYQWST